MILKRTTDIWTELLASINSAETEILFQTFYIDNDVTWIPFLEALNTKAKSGVKVICLIDALGGLGVTDVKTKTLMNEAGVSVIYFNWLSPWSSKNKSIWFFRNHKRSLIIDRKILHLGGWCIGEKTKDWLDGHVIVTNQKVVDTAVSDFERMNTFAHKLGLKIKGEKSYTFIKEDMEAFLYQAPLIRSRYIIYSYLKLMISAENSISFIAPYFAPTRKIVRQIILARKRGVAVSIYLPKKTDHTFVDIAARTYFEKLLRYGVQIYLAPHMIHAKAALFDDTAFVGSMNLDAVSIRFNFENGLMTRDVKIVDELNTDFEALKNNCEKLNWTEWSERSVWQKISERCVRVIRGFL